MKTTSLLRCAGLAVVLAVALPAPASPQLGKWVKKAIKQKVAQTIVGSDTTTSPPPTGTSRTAPGAPAATGPYFSDNVLQITPALLDQLLKGLAAEQADRKAAAAAAAKILSPDDYRKCEQGVNASAEAQQAYQEYASAPKDDIAALRKASETYGKKMDALKLPKCGPGGNDAVSARYDLSQRPIKAGRDAAGLTEYQYAILKERVVPFCSLPQPPAAAATGETRVPAAGTYSAGIAFVYAASEVAALQGRCTALMAALNEPQASPAPAPAPVSARKKRP